MKRITTHSTLAALLTLVALTTPALAQQPTPAGKDEAGNKPAMTSLQPCLSPEQLLQKEPTAAGPLSRAAVIKELQRARAAGEMDWHLRESTGFMR